MHHTLIPVHDILGRRRLPICDQTPILHGTVRLGINGQLLSYVS
jgi:hypothetical protein